MWIAGDLAAETPFVMRWHVSVSCICGARRAAGGPKYRREQYSRHAAHGGTNHAREVFFGVAIAKMVQHRESVVPGRMGGLAWRGDAVGALSGDSAISEAKFPLVRAETRCSTCLGVFGGQKRTRSVCRLPQTPGRPARA